MKLPNIFEKNVVPLFYTAGSTIFEIGQPRDLMFIVQEGEVEIRIGNKVVETVGVDGFFGEMALIDGGTRSATAIAKTDCKLVPINEKQFLFMVQETPFFSLRVMRTLTARIRQVDRRLLQSEVASPNS
jgi:CRP/FNR family transcriptional regulator, cyclic AMP receptor protein